MSHLMTECKNVRVVKHKNNLLTNLVTCAHLFIRLTVLNTKIKVKFSSGFTKCHSLQVEENTNKRIKDLVDPSTLTADTAAVLVNAIFFKVTTIYKYYKIDILNVNY